MVSKENSVSHEQAGHNIYFEHNFLFLHLTVLNFSEKIFFFFFFQTFILAVFSKNIVQCPKTSFFVCLLYIYTFPIKGIVLDS